jgi:hypothetical protein
MPPDAVVETKPDAAAAAGTGAAPSTETSAQQTALPPSPLSTADAAKHEGAAPLPEAKPAEAAAEAKPESTPEAKADAKPDAKAEGDGKPGAESAEQKPPETKADAKPEGEAAKEPPKPEGEAKPEVKADTKEPAEAKPQEPPRYDALKVPEGTSLDAESVKAFDAILGKAEVATEDRHLAMSNMRQELTDFYVKDISRVVNEVRKNQVDVWNRLVEQRVNDLKSDQQLGGNRIETTLGNAKYALETLLPKVTEGSQIPFTKADAQELIGIMDAGGVSHHKLTIKLLNGLFELFAEPEPVPGTLPLGAINDRKEAGKRGWYNTVDGVKAAS